MSDTSEHREPEQKLLPTQEPQPTIDDDVELAPEHEMLRGRVKLNGESYLDFPRDYVPVAESIHELFKLNTLDFEGPLDLLLFLIKRHKLDIFDFPISFLCEKYLEAMKTMEDLDIDVAAEFLAMAAELAHIKSKMLLPPDDDDDEDEEERDPRAELVRRLREYRNANAQTNWEDWSRREEMSSIDHQVVPSQQREDGGLKELVFSLWLHPSTKF